MTAGVPFRWRVSYLECRVQPSHVANMIQLSFVVEALDLA